MLSCAHYPLMQTIGYKCQEIVDGGNKWASILFYESTSKSLDNNSKLKPDLLAPQEYRLPLKNRFFEQRSRHVVDCCNHEMKWCPIADCGAVVKIVSPSNNQVDSTLTASTMCSSNKSGSGKSGKSSIIGRRVYAAFI